MNGAEFSYSNDQFLALQSDFAAAKLIIDPKLKQQAIDEAFARHKDFTRSLTGSEALEVEQRLGFWAIKEHESSL